MKTPRDLSGQRLAHVLCRSWGYREVEQTGSHIILQTETPGHQRMPIPAHKVLRIGTLNAIIRLVANHKGVPREELLKDIT